MSGAVSKYLSSKEKGGKAKSSECLNVPISLQTFLAVARSFEDVVCRCEMEGDSLALAIQTLKSLQKKIQRKIASLSLRQNALRLLDDSLSLSNLSLSSSTSSLHLGASHAAHTVDESLFRKWTKVVCCPFCLERLPGINEFVAHMDNSCIGVDKRLVKENDAVPFSVVQILPTNGFKCNVCHNFIAKNTKFYYNHVDSREHKQNLSTLKKKHVDFLFCSCCKILVANTHIQLEFHIRNNPHVGHAAATKKNALAGSGVSFIYLKEKRFKCFACPTSPKMTSTKDLLAHMDSEKHHQHGFNRGRLNGRPTVFCDPCHCEIPREEILRHFESDSHREEEEKCCPKPFEQCFLCGHTEKNTLELAVHMKMECTKVAEIRQTRNLRKRDNESEEEGSAAPQKGSNPSPGKPPAASAAATREKSGGNESPGAAAEEEEISRLFTKVSSHLANSTKVTESLDHGVLRECADILQCGELIYTSYRACGLTFPGETISVVRREDVSDPGQSVDKINDLKKAYRELVSSYGWEGRALRPQAPLPHIECVHKESEKSFRIYFAGGPLRVTEMLRDCLADNKIVRPFCLIVKFWLSVKLKMVDTEVFLLCIMVFFLRATELVADVEEIADEDVRVSLCAKEGDHGVVKMLPKIGKTKEVSVYSLFEEFLKFLSTFDFQMYAIDLAITHPVKKALLSKYVRDGHQRFGLLSPVIVRSCAQPFNLGSVIEVTDLQTLQRVAAETYRMKGGFLKGENIH